MWVWIFGNMDMFLCLCVLGLGESHVLPLGLMSLGLCVLARALCEPWIRKLLCPSLLHSPLWLVPCLSRSRQVYVKKREADSTLPFMYERPRVVLQRGSQVLRLQMGQMWVYQLPRESLFFCWDFCFVFIYSFPCFLIGCCCLFLLALRQGLTIYPWLVWKPLCRPVTP